MGNGAAVVRANLASMIAEINNRQAVPVVLVRHRHVSGHRIFNGEVDKINSAIRDLCKSEGVKLVDLNKAVTAGMLQADGLHPNSEGQEAIARAFYNTLNKMVH